MMVVTAAREFGGYPIALLHDLRVRRVAEA
jgi:hypothetical protein